MQRAIDGHPAEATAASPASWAVWDVETLRWAHEVPGGWRNPAGFGISVAKALDEQGVMSTFYEADGPALIAHLESKQLVVGFNSIGFDCGVLAAYGDVAGVRRRSLDLLRSIGDATGIPHPVSLNNACKATLGMTKLLDDGAEAVSLWRSESAADRHLVEQYCEQDVRLTHQLWTFGAENGHILAPIGARRRSARPIMQVAVDWPRPLAIAVR